MRSTIGIGPGPGDGPFTFYIDDRASIGGNGLWIHQETNGVYGLDIDADGEVHVHDDLQRGAGCGYCDTRADTCVDIGPWDGDLILF